MRPHVADVAADGVEERPILDGVATSPRAAVSRGGAFVARMKSANCSMSLSVSSGSATVSNAATELPFDVFSVGWRALGDPHLVQICVGQRRTSGWRAGPSIRSVQPPSRLALPSSTGTRITSPRIDDGWLLGQRDERGVGNRLDEPVRRACSATCGTSAPRELPSTRSWMLGWIARSLIKRTARPGRRSSTPLKWPARSSVIWLIAPVIGLAMTRGARIRVVDGPEAIGDELVLFERLAHAVERRSA